MALTPVQIDLVKSMSENGADRIDIASHFGITPQSLSWQLKKVGFSFYKKCRSLAADQINQLITRYSNGESTPEICKDLPCNEDTALRVLRTAGVTIKTKRELKFYKGYTINEDAFCDLDSEEAAYFYGWLLTDGCLSKKSVSLEVASKDEEILVNLQKYMGSSNSIRRRSRVDKRTGNTYHQSSFAFSHDVILDRLISLGLTPRKSLQEICPEEFKYNKHFWRGVIEGDGHISKSQNKVELCGSINLINGFMEYVRVICPEYNSMTVRMNGSMPYTAISSKAVCTEVLRALYEDANLVLTRKHQTYLERYNGT